MSDFWNTKTSKFILDQDKIEKIHKNELTVLSYYIANSLNYYPCLDIARKDEKYIDYIILASFIIDPILHFGKLIVNIVRLPFALMEAFLGVFNVRHCNASNFGNVLAAIFVNIVNIVASFVFGLTRFAVTAIEAFTRNSAPSIDNQKNQKERTHFSNKLDIFNQTKKYQEPESEEGLLKKASSYILSLTSY